MALIHQIPAELLQDYMDRKITSKELADLTGYHAVSIRRAISRPPIVPKPKNKTLLIQARKTFRASLKDLPLAEIQRIAHVSLSTAGRIKRDA